MDFKNTVVIMTSNVGSQLILAYRGGDDAESYEQMKSEVLDVLRQQFRPEFLNRVDEIVVFHSLSREHLKQIVEIQLERLRARLAERHIALDLTERAREHLAAGRLRSELRRAAFEAGRFRRNRDSFRPAVTKGEVKDGQTVIVDYDRASGALKFTVKTDGREAQDEAAVEKACRRRKRMMNPDPSLEERCRLLFSAGKRKSEATVIPIRDTIPSRNTPIGTWILIAANGVVFIFELMLPEPVLQAVFYYFGIVPARYSHPEWAAWVGLPIDDYWPFVTSMFLHGGWLHIIGNMWTLWIFGDNVEDRMGTARYLVFYFICGLAAALVHFFTNPDSTLPTVGASGAIAGVMGAYLLFFPHSRVITLIPLFFFCLCSSRFLPSSTSDSGLSVRFSAACYPWVFPKTSAELRSGRTSAASSQAQRSVGCL